VLRFLHVTCGDIEFFLPGDSNDKSDRRDDDNDDDVNDDEFFLLVEI
jgi:hypothetical protein